MNLLLDTHTLIRWVNGERLSAEATEAIRDPDNLAGVGRRVQRCGDARNRVSSAHDIV